eukprot:g14047.t1
MATFNAEEWTPGFDEFGRQCWYHKVTRSRVYHQFPPPAPAGPIPAPFNPAPDVAAKAMWKQALAGAWKKYETDGEDGKKKPYWYNTMSGETTWDKPDTDEAKPPPPPAPPAEPKETTPVKKEREKDQWKQLRNDKGRKYWHNEKTGENSFETPECLRKYR